MSARADFLPVPEDIILKICDKLSFRNKMVLATAAKPLLAVLKKPLWRLDIDYSRLPALYWAIFRNNIAAGESAINAYQLYGGTHFLSGRGVNWQWACLAICFGNRAMIELLIANCPLDAPRRDVTDKKHEGPDDGCWRAHFGVWECRCNDLDGWPREHALNYRDRRRFTCRETALHLAVCPYNLDAPRLTAALLNAGALPKNNAAAATQGVGLLLIVICVLFSGDKHLKPRRMSTAAKVIKVLLEAGQDPNYLHGEKWEENVLTRALLQGNDEAAKHLIRHGAIWWHDMPNYEITVNDDSTGEHFEFPPMDQVCGSPLTCLIASWPLARASRHMHPNRSSETVLRGILDMIDFMFAEGRQDFTGWTLDTAPIDDSGSSLEHRILRQGVDVAVRTLQRPEIRKSIIATEISTGIAVHLMKKLGWDNSQVSRHMTSEAGISLSDSLQVNSRGIGSGSTRGEWNFVINCRNQLNDEFTEYWSHKPLTERFWWVTSTTSSLEHYNYLPSRNKQYSHIPLRLTA
ncbi:hypothetical protein QBC34DRAFT_431928 [Podospora aff. communis PSN243]|uniref:F-box domain-containing protein n=1 Tax=Podospora aff. communis PSN243 TaxID=3040156 RepID=A0AAV9G4F5_9PEZI|nr:hypothetical protein QBC34DRAFT_431928 [Podospora aff. communis PSN243]